MNAVSIDLKNEKIDVDSFVSGNFDKVADLIYSKHEFQEVFLRVARPDVFNLKAEFNNLRGSLATWSSLPPQTGPEDKKSDCPVNTYAVGFAFQDEPGLAHGALWSGHVICRPLNFPTP